MRTFTMSVLWVLLFSLPLTAEASSDEDAKHLFILSGQSNMTRPLAESFRSCVEQVFGQDKVIVVRYGKPSQPIKRWYKDWKPPAGMTDDKPEDNGTLYDEMMAAVQRAVKEQKLASVTFIWMQGEAEAGKGWAGVYKQSFHGVVKQIQTDLGLNNVNFVVGRINDFWAMDKERFPDGQRMRALQQALGEDNAHGDWINTDDLNRGVNPWGGFSFDDGHYPPPGYRVMGQRFAKQACLLLDPSLKLDAMDVFEERFIDRVEQIKTHSAIGAKVSGTQPINSFGTTTDPIASLTDGKFGKAEDVTTRWYAFKPSEKPIELVVDLGSVQKIESIAVSTLLSSEAKAEFPDKLIYSTSEDGKAYTVHNARYNTISAYGGRKKLFKPGSQTLEPEAVLLLTEQRGGLGADVQARYIKVEVHTGKQWVYLDEVLVNAQRR